MSCLDVPSVRAINLRDLAAPKMFFLTVAQRPGWLAGWGLLFEWFGRTVS